MDALWARFNLGRALTPLEVDLRRVTDSDLIDLPPKDALLCITQASQVADNRREIMRHLQECLSESSGARWRRVRGGLVLLEQLLKDGAPALLNEISEGLHFDPVQRLTFLEKFEYRDDLRVQGMIRQKATALRADVVARLQGSDDQAISSGAAHGGSVSGGGSASSSKPLALSSDEPTDRGAISISSDATAFGWEDRPPTPKKTSVVNGLVSVGHRDDTDSESGSEGGRHRGRKQGKASGAGGAIVAAPRRRVLEDDTDSESDSGKRSSRRSSAKSATAAAQKRSPGGWPEADSPVAGGASKAPPPASVDLLDL